MNEAKDREFNKSLTMAKNVFAEGRMMCTDRSNLERTFGKNVYDECSFKA